jgi:hypothetical protein
MRENGAIRGLAGYFRQIHDLDEPAGQAGIANLVDSAIRGDPQGGLRLTPVTKMLLRFWLDNSRIIPRASGCSGFSSSSKHRKVYFPGFPR